jgi:RNA polymerase sigma factor (sigma-70 family)
MDWADDGGSMVVAGRPVRRWEFIARLQRGERESEMMLLSQLKDDRVSGSSFGLGIVHSAYSVPVIAWLARGMTSADAADECWGWTLGRVYEGCEAYDPTRSRFRTWIFNQAKYSAAAWRRKYRPLAVAAGQGGADVAPAIEDRLTRTEESAVRHAFRRLSEAERRLLWLRYVEGYAPSEIAREGLSGGIPEEHIRVYIARALKRLDKEVRSELQDI